MGERRLRIAVDACFVGPAMRDDVAHPQRARRRVLVESIEGGLTVAFTRMNRILEIDKANLCVIVEPGVITGAIEFAGGNQVAYGYDADGNQTTTTDPAAVTTTRPAQAALLPSVPPTGNLRCSSLWRPVTNQTPCAGSSPTGGASRAFPPASIRLARHGRRAVVADDPRAPSPRLDRR